MGSHKIDQRTRYKLDDHIWYIHESGLDTKNNHLYLDGVKDYIMAGETGEPGVEFVMASKFIRNMNILMRFNPDKPILIHMKTCGGDWTEGMSIHNMIQACPNPVSILSYTHARSMSSLIFQAANKRVMMPDSYFMFHDGTVAYDGTVKKVESEFQFDQGSKERMLDIYVESMLREGKFCKDSPGKIRRMLRRLMDRKEDVFLTAKEAVEWGLADEVFGQSGKYDWSTLTKFTNDQLSR